MRCCIKIWIGTLLGLIFVSSDGLCQTFHLKDSTLSFFLNSKIQSGYVLVDNRKLAQLNLHHPLLFQVDLSILKNRQQVWDYCGCFMKNGISLSYTDLGNAHSLGNAISILLYTEPHLVWSTKFKLTLRTGAGLTYTNRVYHVETNPTNITISKHLSFLLSINPNLYFSINNRTAVNFGVQINHISNGGTRWPNWGLNFATAGIGFEYTIHPQILNKRKTTPFSARSIKYAVHIFGGRHHSDPQDQWTEKRRMVAGINIGVLKPLGRINSLGIGGEIYYDGIAKVLEAQSGMHYHLLIGSVSLQHYFTLGKVLFGQQLAYYVTPLNPNIKTHIYQRYLLEYKIKGPWYAGVSLRAHGKISDYLTLTTGLIF
jgi:hypothetical protein